MSAIATPLRLVCLAAPLLAVGCASPLPRDLNGSPPTARLAPSTTPAAPLTAEERKNLDALNQRILQDQEAAIARDQQAEAWARAYRYSYPATSSYSLYYGGWGRSGWGGGVSWGSPGWGWGAYPYYYW
ncbi:hypothetical protein [Cupriavidus sp. AU9028]|uniref:hypothetical protein n=1 Tax=Cupriavidus sp. AU9028 TaxID=2871157 RepID=UPI001C94189D|nr:hypothetical protein [Cupriavidus sp. AU9028]MBY4898736.1 hypothetical protein [Cupriavidus sp. AU9028]